MFTVVWLVRRASSLTAGGVYEWRSLLEVGVSTHIDGRRLSTDSNHRYL